MQPTELHLQATAFTAAAALIRSAELAGVPQLPLATWCLTGGFVDGILSSADNSALRAFDAWREVLGTGRVRSYTHLAEGGERRVYTVTSTVGDVSVRLAASIPAVLAPRREAVPA